MQPGTISLFVGIVCLLVGCLYSPVECRNRRRVVHNLPIRTRPIKYTYSFDVADDNVQLYQSQSQTREDKVVTGEYSWVDSVGVRRVTRYRADDSGYHILEMREEHPSHEGPILKKGRVRMKEAYRKVRKVRKPKLRQGQVHRKPRVLRVRRKKKKDKEALRSKSFLPLNDFRPDPARPLPIIQANEPSFFLTSAPSLSII
eukprot:TRINITY_DN4652_c0_g1_i2.p1 TRINITY_DN4652_c0_g1~~TRINITY_DN4652_c0_g1_i2.p1  ORF type:complete len:235 (+),score=36.35 TRINITY_DN4652_c0_g1_i2:104-706(+)